MAKHRANPDEVETLGDLLPTMVITDYVSAITVRNALANAASDYRRLSRAALERGDMATADVMVGNATRCTNLAAMAYDEACTIAAAMAADDAEAVQA